MGGGAAKELHFPGLHPEAARWLVDHRKVKIVGLDTPSIDYGQSRLFEGHVILFAKNNPAFENVTRLEQLPEKGFTIVALPMKIKGGELGSPKGRGYFGLTDSIGGFESLIPPLRSRTAPRCGEKGLWSSRVPPPLRL